MLLVPPRSIEAADAGTVPGAFTLTIGGTVARWVAPPATSATTVTSSNNAAGQTKTAVATDDIGDERDYMLGPGTIAASLLVDAERRLRLAVTAAPKDPLIHARLGRFFLAQVNGAKDHGTKYAAASSALLELERARALLNNEEDKLKLMAALVRTSAIVDRQDKARDYAVEWMKKVPVGRWDYANAQHYGHTALGLIAVKAKDLKAAKDQLAMSADHSGSPQLNAYGPCMDLAAALMNQGQKDAVADYLEACGRFWKAGDKQLATWNQALDAGLRPDFTGHFAF